jgi:hypothetical protein
MAESSKTKKCRQYCSEYLKFGFAESQINKQMPMCLVCEKTFFNEAMKPSRMSEHLRRVHTECADKGVTFFQSLRDQLRKRTTIGSVFCKTSQQNTDGFRASYNISLLIAKSGKPHTIGEEVIIPAVSEVIKTVLDKSAEDIIKKTSLSNSSV